MPKKTKKEKIIADYRKKLKLIEQNSTISAPSVSSFSRPVIQQVSPKVNPRPNTENMLVYFKKDFRKSLILIAGIIGLEICLYFATINQYFKFR